MTDWRLVIRDRLSHVRDIEPHVVSQPKRAPPLSLAGARKSPTILSCPFFCREIGILFLFSARLYVDDLSIRLIGLRAQVLVYLGKKLGTVNGIS